MPSLGKTAVKYGIAISSFGEGICYSRVHHCACVRCLQPEDHPDKRLHHQLNLLLSHLSEQQKRWVAAYESKRLGWGGPTLVSLITGLSRVRIRRGQRELDAELHGRPSDRARVPGGGRHPQLTEDQLRLLRGLLSEGATAHGWQNNLWTAKRVAELIRKRLGEDLCIHSVRTALKERLHWTLQKPQIQLKERDEDEITRWKREEFTRIKSEARHRRAYIVFIDESGFMLNPTLRRTYAPSGRPSVEKVTDPHARISVIGAITLTPEDQRANFIFDMLSDNANFKGQSVLAFLRLVHERLNSPITVIWDSVRIHLSKPVTDYLFTHSAIVSEPFPPYAPDLNPVDSAWAYIKYGRLSNYAPIDLVELRNTITAELERLRTQPDLLHAFIRRTGLCVL